MINEPGIRTPFAEVYEKAYDWTVDDEGYLCGLVAGDMGYEQTDMKFDAFLVDAQVAEDRRLHAIGKFPCEWPVREAIRNFIDTGYKAIKANEG